ncbi:mitochondrial ribosomal protein [Annulohypoxylon truncatum]|uniref:mitochondrial ribosomal protein n=1 Tax=Annulohypoxylon truncatum TaxID=327061 RepID=UPI002007CD4F|nr:mitochondrial ribosomal protein [Annulohypoxylon truncatum]KAI1210714.1 mitochondrial ribosomal protein [Annulohypoxylon truncatum]
MGGQRQIRPGKVYQTMTTLLNHRVFPTVKVQQPVWYKVVESIPPSEILVRPLPPQHQNPNPRARKPSRMFQPQQITYEEDELRKTFYRDHPWELARPRMIIEMDGKDSRRYDWSKGLIQPGMPLCGECVVQRQMWMMHTIPGITKEQAYDKARHEFYALRQEEDVERRIAKEEAQMVGAYFGKSFLKVGVDLEDEQFEKWKKWATKQIESVQAERDAAYTSFGVEEEADNVDLDEELAVEDTADKPPAAPAAR